MYDDGIGVKRNDALAAKWYMDAAENGNVGAMTNVGVMFTDGEGVKQDYAKARYYLEKSVKSDSPEGMASLAYLYINGLGVKRDLYKGTQLYTDSCDKGLDEGCKYLAELKSKGLYRTSKVIQTSSAGVKRLIAKSMDASTNATFTWKGDDAIFKANDGKVDCTFLKDFSEKGGQLATSFVCTNNVQIILKQFKESNNAYLSVMTDNFKKEVNTFSVNVYVSE